MQQDHMLLVTSIRDIYNWDTSGESREQWQNISLDQTLFLSLWSESDLSWSWSHSVWKYSRDLASFLPEVGICSTSYSCSWAWHSSYTEQKVHMKHAAKLVSWWSVYWFQPSALADFYIRKPNQAPNHCFQSLLTVCRQCCHGSGCRERVLPACCTNSRLRGHSKIELLTKERVVDLDNIQTDAIEPYPILVQFQGRVWKREEEGKENPKMW